MEQTGQKVNVSRPTFLKGPPLRSVCLAESSERPSIANLLPSLYKELTRMATSRLRREPSNLTLDSTALVHEAYLKLSRQSRFACKGRTHFRAVASEAMHRVLLDHIRARRRLKRGHGFSRVTLSDATARSHGCRELDLMELTAALEKLSKLDPRSAKVVKMRFLSGMTEDEVAHELKKTRRTIQEDWAHAKIWLRRELGHRENAGA